MRRTQRTHPLLGAGQVLKEHRGLEIPFQRPSLEAAVCHGRNLVRVACHRVPNVHGSRLARPFPCLLSYHPHVRRNHPQFAKGQDDNPIQCHCRPGALPWHCQHWDWVILWGRRSWHSVAPSSIPGPHSLNARTPSRGNRECPARSSQATCRPAECAHFLSLPLPRTQMWGWRLSPGLTTCKHMNSVHKATLYCPGRR